MKPLPRNPDHPVISISIGELRERGVFEKSSNRTAVFSWPHDGLPEGSLSTKVVVDENIFTVNLRTILEGSLIEDRFTLIYSDRSNPAPQYFVCPQTGKFVTAVYFGGRHFGTRHQFVSRYASQHRPRRAGRLGEGSLKPLRSTIAKRPRGKRPRPARSPKWDTETALRRGRQDLKRWVWWCLSLASTAREMPHWQFVTEIEAPAPVLVWEDHPRLDLRVLAREGGLQRGGLTGLVLDWPRGGVLDRAFVLVDLRDPMAPVVGVQWHAGLQQGRQSIRLLTPEFGRRQRYVFQCPATLYPSEVLAFRHGRFASREAQRLKNRSQMPRARI